MVWSYPSCVRLTRLRLTCALFYRTGDQASTHASQPALKLEHLQYPNDSPQTKLWFERVFVRENLNCEMPTKVTQYLSKCFKDICVHSACNKIISLPLESIIIAQKRGSKNFWRERDPCLINLKIQRRERKAKFCLICVLIFLWCGRHHVSHSTSLYTHPLTLLYKCFVYSLHSFLTYTSI